MLLASGIAQGQTSNKQRADDAYRAGAEAYSEQAYGAAAEHFETAHRLAPHPDAAFNAARARELAGERARAADLYVTAIGLNGLSEAYVDYANEHLGKLLRTLAVVRITAPLDATVTVAHLQRAAIPINFRLLPGTHRIVVDGGDGRRTTQEVTLVAGETITLSLALPEPKATVPPGPEPRAPGPVAPTDEGVAPNHIAGGVFVGLAAASLGAGIGLGLAAIAANDRWQASGLQERSAYDEALTLRALANIGYFAAAAHALAGGVMLVVPFGDSEPSERGPNEPAATLVASPTALRIVVKF